jgi:hypothetical protein
VKTVERVEIALLAGVVAAKALEFQNQTSLVDEQIKKYFLNNLIMSVNELKTRVLGTSNLLEP